MKTKIYIILCIVILFSCNKEDIYDGPIITLEVSNISMFSVDCHSIITDDKGEEITSKGICWSSSKTPTINDNKTTQGSGKEAFSSTITGLTKNTNYYVRAYIVYKGGTGYSKIISFKTIGSEAEQIAHYIDTAYHGAQPTSSGLYIISRTEGTGISPTLDDYVFINYEGKFLNGQLFDTSDSVKAKANSLSNTWLTYNGPLKIKTYSFYGYGGVTEGLLKMKEGGSYTLVIPSKLAFNDYRPVIYDIQLLKVIKDPKSFEQKQISRYASNWGVDSTTTGVTGLYIKPLDSIRTTPMPEDGKTITLNYTLKLISYEDEGLSIPERFIAKANNYTIVLNSTQYIQGFYGALKKMHVRDSTTIIMPYYRAYGVNAKMDQSDRIELSQYSTLVYDIKIVSVK